MHAHARFVLVIQTGDISCSFKRTPGCAKVVIFWLSSGQELYVRLTLSPMTRSCMVLAPAGVSTTLAPEKHDFLPVLACVCCAVAHFATEVFCVDAVIPDKVPDVTCKDEPKSKSDCWSSH